jgi:DNA invertase Pin-like site-specific DNA recombinase
VDPAPADLSYDHWVYTGRKPALTDEQATELRTRAVAGESKAALATAFGVSRQTVYSYLHPGASD